MNSIEKLFIAASLMGALSLQACDDDSDSTEKPDRRDINVSLSIQSDYDFLGEGKVWYTTESTSGTAVISDGAFVASVGPDDQTITVTIGGNGKTDIPSDQSKYYLDSDYELASGMIASGSGAIGDNDASVTLEALTSALVVRIYDSKHYAYGERIQSVSYEGSSSVTLAWGGTEDDLIPTVNSLSDAAEYALIFPSGTVLSGELTVVTNRHSYDFTVSSQTLAAGASVAFSADCSAPLTQPTRKVGILGDSISTFSGYMDTSYSAFYPASDATSSGGTGTVQSVDKTYWWKVIYEKMSYGELDNNRTNSWSGTRVITESGKGFVDRAYAFDDPDIIIIHGGTNDMNQKTGMGEFDYDLPMGQLSDTEYRSAYIKLIKMLQNRYTGVKIIIIVGDRLSRYEYNGSDPTYNYATSTIEIAQHFGLPYVDFTSGGTTYNTLSKSTGSHPDATGMQEMADKIYSTCTDYLP